MPINTSFGGYTPQFTPMNGASGPGQTPAAGPPPAPTGQDSSSLSPDALQGGAEAITSALGGLLAGLTQNHGPSQPGAGQQQNGAAGAVAPLLQVGAKVLQGVAGALGGGQSPPGGQPAGGGQPQGAAPAAQGGQGPQGPQGGGGGLLGLGAKILQGVASALGGGQSPPSAPGGAAGQQPAGAPGAKPSGGTDVTGKLLLEIAKKVYSGQQGPGGAF